jgi:hypothetical protein
MDSQVFNQQPVALPFKIIHFFTTSKSLLVFWLQYSIETQFAKNFLIDLINSRFVVGQ